MTNRAAGIALTGGLLSFDAPVIEMMMEVVPPLGLTVSRNGLVSAPKALVAVSCTTNVPVNPGVT